MDRPPLSRDDALHLARLARLDVDASQLDELTGRLEALLAYFTRLDRLDLTDVPEMPHVGDETNVLADDQPGQAISRQTLLDMAPASFEAFVRVPKILGDGGGA